MGEFMSSILSICGWVCGRRDNNNNNVSKSRKRNREILKKEREEEEEEASKVENFFRININDDDRQNLSSNITPGIVVRHANYSSNQSKRRIIGGYNTSQRILLVGEGDFSFSVSLARAFLYASNMVSTSLDSFEFLKENYSRSMENVAELKARGCTVVHDISATEIANHSVLGTIKFDRIIFNFPLAGFFGRHVPRDIQIGMNQALVYLFMGNAKKMIEEDGEIHITHKAYGFFRQWNLQQLGYSQGLRLIEEVNFDRTLYPGYHTKYGFGGDNNFDCHNSKTYKFKLMLT